MKVIAGIGIAALVAVAVILVKLWKLAGFIVQEFECWKGTEHDHSQMQSIRNDFEYNPKSERS